MKRPKRDARPSMIHQRITDICGIRQEGYSRNPPLVAYRFFRKEADAEALARGDVWITTLGDCRRRELADGGDPDEGILRYTHDDVSGSVNDPAIREIIQRLGVPLPGNVANVTLEGNVGISRAPDAWVLCTTSRFAPEKMEPKYGTYCVEIRNMIEFLHQTTQALINEGAQLRGVTHGYVHYMEPVYKNLDRVPRQPGFMKSPDQYSDEQEFRIIWWPVLNPTAPPEPRLLRNAVHKSRFRRLR